MYDDGYKNIVNVDVRASVSISLTGRTLTDDWPGHGVFAHRDRAHACEESRSSRDAMYLITPIEFSHDL